MQSNQPSVFAHTVNKPRSVQLQQGIRVRSIFPVPTKMQLMPSFGVRVALGPLSDQNLRAMSFDQHVPEAHCCPPSAHAPAPGKLTVPLA